LQLAYRAVPVKFLFSLFKAGKGKKNEALVNHGRQIKIKGMVVYMICKNKGTEKSSIHIINKGNKKCYITKGFSPETSEVF
jgi:hypothetical protein